MPRHPINPDARSLEESFFARENARLLERLRQKRIEEEQRDALSEALRIDDDDLLDHLVELGLGPETALALTLVPLAAVAWADGTMSPGERDAILRAAEETGVEAGSPGHDLLEHWLEHRPEERLLEAWTRYARTLFQALDDHDREAMRRRLLGQAQQVAEAAGGFLGLGSKVSAEERRVLDELRSTLSQGSSR
jgi:tellurite resistance protein